MRNLVMTVLFVLPLQLAAQEFDLSLPGKPMKAANEAAAQNNQKRETWFGMGYESRRDEEVRNSFKSNHSGGSVFSRGAMQVSSPAAGGGGRGR